MTLKSSEQRINKALDKIWSQGKTPAELGLFPAIITVGGFNKKNYKFYKKIKGNYVRVYKKYGFMPKTKGASK